MLQRAGGLCVPIGPILPSEGGLQHKPRGRPGDARGDPDLLAEGWRGASEETRSG